MEWVVWVVVGAMCLVVLMGEVMFWRTVNKLVDIYVLLADQNMRESITDEKSMNADKKAKMEN